MKNKLGLWLLPSAIMLITGCSSASTKEEALGKAAGCKGVFYWEPECKPSQYKLGAFTKDGRPTWIMDAFKEK